MAKKLWRKPEVRALKAGAAETQSGQSCDNAGGGCSKKS